MGGLLALPGFDTAEDTAGRGSPDFLPRAHGRPVLRPHHRQGGDARGGRRSRGLHQERSAYHVEQSGPACGSADRGCAGDRGRQPDAIPHQLRQGRIDVGPAGMRLSRLRCPALQSAARSAAAGHQGRRRERRWRLARPVHQAGRVGGRGKAGGQRDGAHQAQRIDVRRRVAPLCGVAATAANRLAGGPARSASEQGAGADPRPAGAQLDGGGAGEGGRAVAHGARRALHENRRHAANALSRQVADADRLGIAQCRQQQRREHRGGDRLRVGGSVQPRLQEDDRRPALRLAAGYPGCARFRKRGASETARAD